MPRKNRTCGATILVGFLSILVPAQSALAGEISGQDQDTAASDDTYHRLKAYQEQIEKQKKLLEQQSRQIQHMDATLKAQGVRIDALEHAGVANGNAARVIPAVQRVGPPDVADGSNPQRIAETTETQPSQRPVGQAPGPEPRPQVQLLPDLGGVLTPKGTLSLEPSVEFDHTSTNQLIFRGISIVQGLLIGVIDASDIRGDTFVGALTGRYGVTNRFEIEGKVPYLYRENRETDTPATSNAQPFKTSSNGNALGDIEAAVHYQFNSGRDEWPIFVGNLRYKSDTGNGPFDVATDPNTGVATELPTGSGFNAIQPSLTMIFPSDPVVFFGNLEYVHNFSKDIGKVVSYTCGPQNDQPCYVGKVTPGDSYGVTLGMSVALNERASFSLGYQHNYIEGTNVSISGDDFKSDPVQVGALLVGAAYQVSPRVGLNFSTQVGVTTDAPDVRVILRIPITFDLF